MTICDKCKSEIKSVLTIMTVRGKDLCDSCYQEYRIADKSSAIKIEEWLGVKDSIDTDLI